MGTSFDQTLGGTLTSPNNQHFGPNGDTDKNESFRLTIQNINYVSGELGPQPATFNGFSQLAIFAAPEVGEDYILGTTGATVITPGGNPVLLGNPTTLVLTATTNNNRPRDLQFSFDVPIPEPRASFFLAGLILFVFLSRGKRRLLAS